MLTLFLRDGDDVYRTYNTTQRGVDRLLFVNNMLDLAPYGRQQDWEDSPPGPSTPPTAELRGTRAGTPIASPPLIPSPLLIASADPVCPALPSCPEFPSRPANRKRSWWIGAWR